MHINITAMAHPIASAPPCFQAFEQVAQAKGVKATKFIVGSNDNIFRFTVEADPVDEKPDGSQKRKTSCEGDPKTGPTSLQEQRPNAKSDTEQGGDPYKNEVKSFNRHGKIVLSESAGQLSYLAARGQSLACIVEPVALCRISILDGVSLRPAGEKHAEKGHHDRHSVEQVDQRLLMI